MVEDKRTALLQSTVRAVAKHGMRDVSTRSISGDAGVNDAYIYRYFRDKEDMLAQAYALEHSAFMNRFLAQAKALHEIPLGLSFEEQLTMDFRCAWRYLIDNPDVCRFFVYYYHSPNFKKYAYEGHRRQVDCLAEQMLPLFDSLEDAENCLYAVFHLLYSFTLQVVDGDLPDNEGTWNRVAKTLLGTMSAHTKIPGQDGAATQK